MSWWDDGHNGFVQDTSNNFANYSRADTDVRHRAVASWIWDLPKFTSERWAGPFVNGWEITGVATFQGGMPYDVVTGTDNSRTGIGRDRPNLVGDWRMPDDRSTGEKLDQWFNTKAFVPNNIGEFGNLGRNVLRGPGIINFDLGVFKNFRLTEAHSIQFRAEAFNAFNRANFGNPVSRLASPTYGKVLSATAARVMQFGLKYSF
jgi:hypothetical protein